MSQQPPAPAPGRGACPICGRPPAKEPRYQPFCSERCKWVDLGRWLQGDYRVPGEASETPPGLGGDPDES